MTINNTLLANWSNEIFIALNDSNSQYVALLDIKGDLLYANTAFQRLFSGELYLNFLNPTFDNFIELKDNKPNVFNGHITIGDLKKLNSSIDGRVYFNDNQFLVVGSVNTKELKANNDVMHRLNRQVNSLQRDLIKEKAMLEKTMADLHIVNDELEIANASKDKFFSIISHDLLSPFNTILGFSQLLIDNIKNNKLDNMGKFAGHIYESADHTIKLLRNLIDWSQTQRGKMTFNPEPIYFEEFVSEFFPLLDNIAKHKSIVLSTDIKFYHSLIADKAMLETIVRNLVSNAIKFTPEGGNILVSAILKDDMVRISVEDNGVGIPKSSIDKIFSIDNNYSTNGTNKEKGTGLGLILCYEFIEAHKGRIWVESEVGLGTKFIFELPLSINN